MTVRAKFRCLGINAKYDGLFIAELKPVMQRGSNSEENKRFWEASPNGDCELVFNKCCPLVPGAYYYLDLSPVNDMEGPISKLEIEERWSLEVVTEFGAGNSEVSFSYWRQYDYKLPRPDGLASGRLKLGLDAKKGRAAYENFSHPGSKWKLAVSFAEASDSP